MTPLPSAQIYPGENQQQIVNRVAGTADQAEKHIVGSRTGLRRLTYYQQLTPGLVAKLKASFEIGRSGGIADQYQGHADALRFGFYFAQNRDPGPAPRYFVPSWLRVESDADTRRVGEFLTDLAKRSDSAFAGVLKALEGAIAPWTDGNVYITNDEVTALTRAVSAYQTATQLFDSTVVLYDQVKADDPWVDDPPIFVQPAV